jgi:hypothetical protein
LVGYNCRRRVELWGLIHSGSITATKAHPKATQDRIEAIDSHLEENEGLALLRLSLEQWRLTLEPWIGFLPTKTFMLTGGSL